MKYLISLTITKLIYGCALSCLIMLCSCFQMEPEPEAGAAPSPNQAALMESSPVIGSTDTAGVAKDSSKIVVGKVGKTAIRVIIPTAVLAKNKVGAELIDSGTLKCQSVNHFASSK
jgi:hypothetical protein